MTTYFYFTDEQINCTNNWARNVGFGRVPTIARDNGCRKIVKGRYYFYSDEENKSPLGSDEKIMVHNRDKVKICDEEEIKRIFTIRSLENL